MTTAYVYKWTHLPTMKWYVGSRTKQNCHPNDGYVCSSKLIKPLILKNKHEWKREIIDFGSVEEMFELESQILQMFDAKNDLRSFNGHNNDGKFTMLGKGGYKRPGVGGAKKGRTPWNKGLTKDDSRVLNYVIKASAKRKGKKLLKTSNYKGKVKTLSNNLPWKGLYVSPQEKYYLTTVAASLEHNVHRMTIYRWAIANKNGWKFIPKKLVTSEIYEVLHKGEI